MAYVKVGWLETVSITHTRLNAMETQYDEFKIDFDAHVHDDRYYTEAEADARFFSAATDGDGSGLDADTVDGYDTEAIEAAAIPRGAIGMWSGTYEAIPSGFVACNGLNSTPDLRNKMVVGAGSSYSKGETGGYATRTPTGTLAVATHTLSIAELPEHDHSYSDKYNNSDTFAMVEFSGGPDVQPSHNRTTTAKGGGDPHGHSGSTVAFDPYNNMPPYHALWFVMRELAS